MQIGVGGIFFGEKNILNKIDWKCPSFLIDYVRIYEPFDGQNHSLEEIPECQFRIIDPFRDHQLIDAICLEKRQKSTEDVIESSTTSVTSSSSVENQMGNFNYRFGSSINFSFFPLEIDLILF